MSIEPVYTKTTAFYASLLDKIPAAPVGLRELEGIITDMFEMVSSDTHKKIEHGYDYFSVDSAIKPETELPDGNKRYTMFNSFTSRDQKYELRRFIEDLTMAYYKCHGGKEFLKTQDLLDALNKEPAVTAVMVKNTVTLSDDTPFKCSVNGVELSSHTLMELSSFYEASCTAEYVSENRPDLTGEQALDVGYETRRLMDKYGYEELDAIGAAMNKLSLGSLELDNNEPDEEPGI